MSSGFILIENARQHNLKGISVRLPRRAFTVVTGPSGSGKSSLAFDTLYAEGQRRYVESLSTYAKQFLERMQKPDVDRLEGISPAVAIEQKNPTTSSRSTVGTATEIYDYLRLLFARVGRVSCVTCNGPVTQDSPSTAAQEVVHSLNGEPISVAFPLPRSEHPDHALIKENLQSMGFVRIFKDGEYFHLDDDLGPIRLDKDDIMVVVDRIKVTPAMQGRLADSIAVAFAEGEGSAEVICGERTLHFSGRPRCKICKKPGVAPSPNLFSFNNPHGACSTCNGFGATLEYDESLIVPNPELSIKEGALDPWTKPRYESRRKLLRETAVKENVPYETPWNRLEPTQKNLFLVGKSGRFTGMMPFLKGLERKKYKQYIRVFLRQYQKAITCTTCGGMRLRAEALSVTVGDRSIGEIAAMTAGDIIEWIKNLELTPFEKGIADTILRELETRVMFLRDVGLNYLSLDRQTRTLSGGEAQRISLTNALGANLVDTLYVLDEPSIGLHPRDTHLLLNLLQRLRTTGNTVVVVEHDPSAIKAADYMIELGPKSGANGGELVFSGPVEDAYQAQTLTGDYLSGRKRIPVPSARRKAGPLWLTVKGARLHNLKGTDVDIPHGTLTVVTGVSGSGKSTLVHDVIYRQMALKLQGAHGAKEHLGEEIGSVQKMTGWETFDEVVLIDQSPIGRSPRSNPVTYIKAFDEIRQLFSKAPLSQARGYTPTTFSFNATKGGRCRACEGAGHLQIEMVFLADVFAPCEACGATRFEREVLDVTIRGYNIHDVLNFTIDQAISHFRHQQKLGKSLWHLQQVGLGYLKLGQPATTLSGGEAQRLKIARQLSQVSKKRERRLYILDEPTTGLHLDDVRVLLKVLDRLVDAGHTVVVIEHHLDVIKRADWVIDMGPEGGDGGGAVAAAGTPEAVAESGTHTGKFLSQVLAEDQRDPNLGNQAAAQAS